LYLTLFDNPQTACVPFGDRSVRVQRVRVCSASAGANRQSYFLICSSAFRFPPVLVSYHFIESAKETVQDVGSSTEPRRAISYSPFPAELGTSPVSQDFTFSTATVPLSEAEVDTVGPLAHIRQNLEIDNLRLSDFEVRPPCGCLALPSWSRENCQRTHVDGRAWAQSLDALGVDAPAVPLPLFFEDTFQGNFCSLVPTFSATSDLPVIWSPSTCISKRIELVALQLQGKRACRDHDYFYPRRPKIFRPREERG
jgi:hypothetical protein